MSKHKGKPSGKNTIEDTGMPTNLTPDTIGTNEQHTQKYTEDDTTISPQVPVRNPNRNLKKGHATNAHGYKNR